MALPRTMAQLDYRLIHRAADRHLPAIEKALLHTIRRVSRAIPEGHLIEAVAYGNVGFIADLVYAHLAPPPVQKAADLPEPLEATVLTIMTEAAEAADAAIGFALIDPLMVDQANRFAAELVTQVTQPIRDTIRQAITHGIANGLTPAITAKTIRQTLGLTPQQATAVANYRLGLSAIMGGAQATAFLSRYTLADRRYATTNLSTTKIDTMVGNYAERQLTHRANMIARTETMRAANMGVRSRWVAHLDRGDFLPEMAMVWIVTPDDKLCPLCAPMADKVVGIRQGFAAQNAFVYTPPLHPACRCTIGLTDTGL